jgi:hypothetical protein
MQCDAPKLTMKGKNMTEAQWDILRDAMHKVIAMQSDNMHANLSQNIPQPCDDILAKKRKITGTLGNILRHGNYTAEQKAAVKASFNAADYMDVPDAEIKDALQTWIALDFCEDICEKTMSQNKEICEKNSSQSATDLREVCENLRDLREKSAESHTVYNTTNTTKDDIQSIMNSSLEQKDIVELTKNKETAVVSSDSACEQKLPQPKRFVKPTLEEVAAYCAEYCTGDRKKVDPAAFIDFYISKGWMVGKNPMKDWKAAVRNWERLSRNNSSIFNNNTNRYEKPKDIRFHTGISKKDWAGERARAEADNARRNPNYAAQEAERLRLLKNFSERLKPSTAT